MIVFPQLSSGAVAQFPFHRELQFRTQLNSTADGAETRVSDVDYQSRAWRLSMSQLTDQEWQQIESLFLQVEGRLKSFLFLDPGASLLSWSEQLNDPVWQQDTSISVVTGQPDPFGGNGAANVASSGAQGEVFQTLNIPAWFRYAGSIWARTSDTGALLRIGDDGVETVEVGIGSGNQWRRYSVGYMLPSLAETIVFRVVVPAGASVQVYGPQLEAQPAPSTYKKTAERAGVYPNARFDQDILGDQLTGVGRHSGEIRITWTPSQA